MVSHVVAMTHTPVHTPVEIMRMYERAILVAKLQYVAGAPASPKLALDPFACQACLTSLLTIGFAASARLAWTECPSLLHLHKPVSKAPFVTQVRLRNVWRVTEGTAR